MGDMEIRYGSHAVERMMQRGISPQEVEDILRNPDGVIVQSRDKVIAHKNVEGRSDNAIAVVAVEDGRAWSVITVMAHFEVRE